MRTLAIINQKGGCGKTTTAVNLSAALADKGYRVLLVDLDPQGHATLGVGVDPSKLDESIYDILMNPERSIQEIIRWTDIKNLWVAPSNILLSGAEIQLVSRIGREKILEEIFANLDSSHYDFVIIDCAPSLSLLAVNAMNFAKKLIIPIQAHYYAMEGMKQLFNTVEQVRRRLNPDLRVLGVLLTMVDARTTISREVIQAVREHLKDKVFCTEIRSNVKLTEAPSAGQPISLYDPASLGARDYASLALEVLSREFGNRDDRLSSPEKSGVLDVQEETLGTV
ncbi:MAG: ParA family protein [Candidatus Omnitrophica bacterium]|nr:ParA family protein [Candidatus Omnitrophota bacterium]